MTYLGKNKNGKGLIPDRGSCSLSTQLMEDRLWCASGPVQIQFCYIYLKCPLQWRDVNTGGPKSIQNPDYVKIHPLRVNFSPKSYELGRNYVLSCALLLLLAD